MKISQMCHRKIGVFPFNLFYEIEIVFCNSGTLQGVGDLAVPISSSSPKSNVALCRHLHDLSCFVQARSATENSIAVCSTT